MFVPGSKKEGGYASLYKYKNNYGIWKTDLAALEEIH
jgi:hypothetical protein